MLLLLLLLLSECVLSPSGSGEPTALLLPLYIWAHADTLCLCTIKMLRVSRRVLPRSFERARCFLTVVHPACWRAATRPLHLL